MSTNSSSTTKSWTIEDIINNASNWNLAGDANLLKYLESFSEELLSKASETNNNLTNLLDSLNTTSMSLDLVKNEFNSLHNNQFIESRVYEDDETVVEEDNPENVEVSKQSETEKAEAIKKAVMRGIEVVNKYFDKVDVPDSDSEEEADFPNFVLRPKDPYVDRPLPFVIGTEEWHKKWHVGLLDSSSDSETERVSDKYSDSDDDLPIQNRTHTENSYNTGSDMDIPNRLNNPVANSTFEDTSNKRDIFDSSDSDEYNNSVPAETPISDKTFAQELAAKLGNVIEQNRQIIDPEVNTKPIQPIQPITRTYGNIFADEPPPLDDEDDDELFGNSNEHDGLFSGRGALFDDLNDDSSNSWNSNIKSNKIPSSESANLFDNKSSDIFDNQAHSSSTFKKTSGGLFDEEDDIYSDNDLFTDKPIASSKPLLQPFNHPTMPYFDDKPPEFEPVKAKKPIGGVKVLDSGDLFGKQTIGSMLKNRKPPSISDNSSEDEAPSKPNPVPVIKNETIRTAVINKVENKPVEVVKTEESVTPQTKPKQISLFDDDGEDEVDELFKDDLFSNISTNKFTSSLFDDDDDDDDFLKSNEVFSKPNKSESESKDTLSSVLENPSEKLVLNDTSVSEDTLSVKNETVETTNENKQLDMPNEEISSRNEEVNIVEEPPPDDDWETGSEHNFFDPSSLFSESSGIIRDANTTRVETDDSFNPNICSSRRLSCENYNEEQLNDSLFTKNKNGSASQIGKNITSIPEVSNESITSSVLDITPSGNLDDLYSEISGNNNTDSKNEHSKVFEPNINFSASVDTKSEVETPKILVKPIVGKKPSLEEKSNLIPKELKIGKLKHNLNINVSALMPGVSPPRRKESEKQSDSALITEATITKNVDVSSPTLVKSNEEDFTHQKSPSPKSETVNLEKNITDSEVLTSITKDRPKILVKRRPSTRKARQESIRNSISDFKLNLSPTEIPATENNVSIDISNNSSGINVVSSESAEREILSSNSDDYDKYVTEYSEKNVKRNILSESEKKDVLGGDIVKTDISSNKNVKIDIFNTNSIEDNSLNNKSEDILSNTTEETIKVVGKDIFSDESAEKDTFNSNSVEKDIFNINSVEEPVAITNPIAMKFEDIFGDDDDVEKDLFANPSSAINDIFSKSDKIDSKSLFDDSPETSVSLFGVKEVSGAKTEHSKEAKIMSTANMVKQSSVSRPKSSSTLEVKKGSLFEDSEEYDDIFSSSKLPSKSSTLRKSLFDDEDDDDLFGPSIGSQNSEAKVKTKVVERKKVVPVKKLENTQVVDDPLGFFKE